MQPHRYTSLRGCTGHFQYPRADRPSCSNMISGLINNISSVFQYPRADRPSCSVALVQVREAGACLSVSSCGSTLMQPYLALDTRLWKVLLSVSSCGSTLMQRTQEEQERAAYEPFSILVRIDPHAASAHSVVFKERTHLSVSSCGSTLMQ